ncbi:CBS domain-containing protein, partial [Enterococcus faecium]
FNGIFTRKEVLIAVIFMVHELERRNILSPKIEELKEQIDNVS